MSDDDAPPIRYQLVVEAVQAARQVKRAQKLVDNWINLRETRLNRLTDAELSSYHERLRDNG